MLVDLTTADNYDDSANYPISVADLKTRMRVGGTSEDALIAEYIVTATTMLEDYTRRSFVEQSHTLKIDQIQNYQFDGSRSTIYLGMPKIIAVQSLKFFDGDNVSTTVASSEYFVDLENGRITPNEGEAWQLDQRSLNAIEVSYTGGYVADGNGSDLPSAIKTAVGMLAMYLYESRMGECEIPQTVKAVLRRHLINRIGIPYMGIDFANIVIRSGSLRNGY